MRRTGCKLAGGVQTHVVFDVCCEHVDRELRKTGASIVEGVRSQGSKQEGGLVAGR